MEVGCRQRTASLTGAAGHVPRLGSDWGWAVPRGIPLWPANDGLVDRDSPVLPVESDAFLDVRMGLRRFVAVLHRSTVLCWWHDPVHIGDGVQGSPSFPQVLVGPLKVVQPLNHVLLVYLCEHRLVGRKLWPR